MSDISLQEAVKVALDARLLDVHTAFPANVLAFNPITRTATVQPAVRRALDGQEATRIAYETLKVIPNVPVLLGAGLAPGDKVIVICSEVDSQMWENSGGIQDPKDLTRHGLGSPFCVPFMPTLTIGNPLTAVAVALQSQLEQLKLAIDAAAAAETSASGLGGMNSLKGALAATSWPAAALPTTGPAANLKASPVL